MRTLTADSSFISRGFCNWKDATTMFRKHEQSACHRQAVEVMLTLPAITKDIGTLLSQENATQRDENRMMLLKIMYALRFLAHQGLALRGDG